MLIYGSDWGVYKQAAGIPLEEGERGFGGGHSLSYEQRIALGEAELAAESRGSTLLEMAQRGKAYNQDTGRFENSAAAQQSANQWLENTLSQLGFPVEADGVISREERQMVREAEKAAGLERSNGMISHKELDRLHAADTAARKDGGETLYSKAEKGEVYNPTIDGFSPTNVPDARAAGGRAQGGMSV
jgi:hypothetical protein